ncbi:MAG: tetratricopeptide repeat protein [Candidatus Hatepunaea meridiana]|nr:tetratricopeptide repeat protein [Candidatus Hatepunaea meridiana]
MKFHIDWGWVVLLAPMSIVVVVLLFEQTHWVTEQTSQGVHYEASTHVNLGRSAMKLGNYQEAIGQYQTALTMDPEYNEAYMGLGIVLNIQGDYDNAIRCIKQAISLDSLNQGTGYGNLGMVYAHKKEYNVALQYFRKSLAIDSTIAGNYRNIGSIGSVKMDWQMAALAYSKAIENKPNIRSLYRNMRKEALEKYKDDENFQKIKEYLDHSISEDSLAEFDHKIVDELAEKDPKLAEDHKNLARAYTKLGKLEDAILQYNAALKITPNDAVTYNRLGILYARTDDLENALLKFRKAVQLDPSYGDAKANLDHCEKRLADK